jgi:regulator of cell morphogenesis and NO signaling
MFTAQSTLRSIALAQPATIRVFERFHLDYCCGGARPLEEACAEKALNVANVLAALHQVAPEQVVTAPLDRDFSQATPTELIRHIVQTHHAYIRSELPRLVSLSNRVAAKHGPVHPEYIQVEERIAVLNTELLNHLSKEEIILFPYIESLERFSSQGGDAPHACFATVASPIQMMMSEHEAAGALLESMRTSTGGFTPPANACPTLVGLLDALDAFERDLHRHVHLENNLLFPLAVALEKQALVAEHSC